MDYQQLRKNLNSRIVLLFFCLTVLFLICGCGAGNVRPNEVKSTIKLNIGPPEPYKLAIQEIEAKDIDKALRYLDLVIKDFPDNEEYVYRSHLLKTIIYTDFYSANIEITDALLEGVKDNPFLKTDESRQMLDYTQSTLDEIDKYKRPLLESATYVYEHYEKNKNLDFTLDYSYSDDETEDLRSVGWFRQSGTPMPSEDQINSAIYDLRVYYIGVSIDELIKKNKVNYPAYFYATGGVANEWDKDFAKKLLEKIIEITKDDKYNKYRLDAEDGLKSLQNEGQ